MTHDESKVLLVSLVDEINQIKEYQEYLKIAYDLIENPTTKTSNRIELLLSTYLQQVEAHFDNLDYLFKQREKLHGNLLIEE
jgi:hypothetical protein